MQLKHFAFVAAWLGIASSAQAQMRLPLSVTDSGVSEFLGLNKIAHKIFYSNEMVLPETILFNYPDGTSSWGQPSDKFLKGYNGRCGETSAANIITMTSHAVSPAKIAKEMGDITPGTRPGTLEKTLNNHAPGIWATGVAPKNEEEAIATLRYLLTIGSFKAPNGKSPVALLLQEGGLLLHWVTVVDVLDDNTVLANHSGVQERIPADELYTKWSFQFKKGRGKVLSTACCYPMTVIYQTK